MRGPSFCTLVPRTLTSTKQLMYRTHMAKRSPFITCSAILAVVGFTSIALAGDRSASLVVTVDGADSICAESDVPVADANESACFATVRANKIVELEMRAAPLVTDPAGYKACVDACKAGGMTILRYCGTMPTPQFRVMCFAAAAIGTVSCINFCNARFML